MGGQRVIKFYGGGQLLCRPSTAASAAIYSVRSASKCFEDFEVLVQPVATSETVSGREEEERSEESATIGDTAPKSDRLKVQQEVLRTEEGAEEPEEEDRLGSPCNLATSPPARLSTLTGEASRRVGGETPEEAGCTESEAKLTLGESGPGYMYRMEEGCCCCCSGKV